ncbi:MAG: winged helix-turn-helix transcriptional regulator [Clostridiaceae bacterium]|nr:winged helix-turn-helix transcriptional regulator [Clostridiaceae bacterium]
MKDKYDIEIYADVLKVLGNKTRLSIVKILDRSESCVCYFTELFEMSQSAISQHMQRLKDIELIKEDPRKQWVFYTLDKDSIYYPFVKSIIDQIPDDIFDVDEIDSFMEERCC